MGSILKQLNEDDRFNILMFDSEVTPWLAASVSATAENVENATSFVLSSGAYGSTVAFKHKICLKRRSKTSENCCFVQ